MLGDGIFHYLTVLCHSIELYLVGLLHELGDNHWEFLTYLAGKLEEAVQFIIVVAHVHGSTGEHIARTYQYREAYAVHECLHIFHGSEGAPFRLVDAQLIQHGTELATVLGTVDGYRAGSQDRHTLAVKLHSQVVRYLSAHADNDTAWVLQVDDVEHALEGKFIEVEVVAHVVVGGYGLRVIVDHDALVT